MIRLESENAAKETSEDRTSQRTITKCDDDQKDNALYSRQAVKCTIVSACFSIVAVVVVVVGLTWYEPCESNCLSFSFYVQ